MWEEGERRRPWCVIEKVLEVVRERAEVKPKRMSPAVAEEGSDRQRCRGSGSKDSTRTGIIVGDAVMRDVRGTYVV